MQHGTFVSNKDSFYSLTLTICLPYMTDMTDCSICSKDLCIIVLVQARYLIGLYLLLDLICPDLGPGVDSKKSTDLLDYIFFFIVKLTVERVFKSNFNHSTDFSLKFDLLIR